MPPSQVSEEEWICRFILSGQWIDDLQQSTPSASRASNRQLSVFHPERVEELGSTVRDLCIEQLSGAGEAYLQVKLCVELAQGISSQFAPKVYWRPDKVHETWECWKDAHAQVESLGGNSGFPMSYRSLLAEKATCLRPPEET